MNVINRDLDIAKHFYSPFGVAERWNSASTCSQLFPLGSFFYSESRTKDELVLRFRNHDNSNPKRALCPVPHSRRVMSIPEVLRPPSRYRYTPSELDGIEDFEDYRPGGLHPVSIGDVFSNGHYKVLHKLGSGGFSTVWLARDLKGHAEAGDTGMLVALKVLAADISSKPLEEIPDLQVPRELFRAFGNSDCPARKHTQLVEDYFFEEGPNGIHLCLVQELLGPSIYSFSSTPGFPPLGRRLRGDLARRAAKQVAEAVNLLHSVGIVHRDLTSFNVLLRLSEEVPKWSDDELYEILGHPRSQQVFLSDGSLPDSSAPKKAFESIDISRLCSSQYLRPDAVLIDFGVSFFIDRKPSDRFPAIPEHYRSPEALLDKRVDLASDIWALACLIFEIRAGHSLFEDFCADADTILMYMVEMLGKLPEPWWGSWDARPEWFDESGEPKAGETADSFSATKTSILQVVSKIGEWDEKRKMCNGDMLEKSGTRLHQQEINLLTDLLEKMLRYRPEERIKAREVLQHSWFSYDSYSPSSD